MSKGNSKIAASLLIIALISASTPFALAQNDAGSEKEQQQAQADDSASQNKTNEDGEEKQAKAKQDDAEQRRGRNNTFIPSEEISDDLSVSFPVDI